MSIHWKPKRKAWLTSFVAILIVLLVGFGLRTLGFSIETSQMPRLMAARDLWNQQHNVDASQITVRVFVPLVRNCTETITSFAGKVTSQGDCDGQPLLDSSEPVSQFTMDKLFDYAAAKLSDAPPLRLALCPTGYTVQFDTDTGYIKQIVDNQCTPSGLLCQGAIADCQSFAKVTRVIVE